jgi:RNA polymerase sigma factor (sigma-70 family)
MSSQSSHLDDTSSQSDRSRGTNLPALAQLRDQCHGPLTNILFSRGASRTEAEDLLADLWADCVPGNTDKPSLLEKFSGKCTLQGWLATVATNRWLDLKRRQSRNVDLTRREHDASDPDPFASVPADSISNKEDSLVALLRESLRAAFGSCSPSAMVLLRLVYLHDLTQREIVQMLGWSESKVSRYLSRAMEEIETHTLRELRKRDPFIELSWRDFQDLCETYQLGFL